jgi:hypothetical protein
MSFFQTLEDDAITLMWRKFDVFLIDEFKKENADLPEDDVNSAIKDGNLTIKWQEETDLELSEREEYLVLNFGTEEQIESFNKWKEVK